MFTGIIEKIGKVHSIDRKGDSSVIGLQINEVDCSCLLYTSDAADE